jgi:hypothetical protein
MAEGTSLVDGDADRAIAANELQSAGIILGVSFRLDRLCRFRYVGIEQHNVHSLLIFGEELPADFASQFVLRTRFAKCCFPVVFLTDMGRRATRGQEAKPRLSQRSLTVLV